jgi:hypothetical protein
MEVNLFFKQHSAPCICFLTKEQIFFSHKDFIPLFSISLILVEILKKYVNNHKRKGTFVSVYTLTACKGNSCIASFIHKHLYGYDWTVYRVRLFTRGKKLRFLMNRRFGGPQKPFGVIVGRNAVTIAACFGRSL